MPICQCCGRKWPYKEVIKSFFIINRQGQKCIYCGAAQFQTVGSSQRFVTLTLPVWILILILANILHLSLMRIVISAFAGSFISVVLIYPFALELSSHRSGSLGGKKG
ncbi:TIGR04104 family putative zinc finger protein [Halobacillus salinarum]|uniref:TIGR04104 family putative zinc finger protein n=1 Tax=Halobacillus salinarum TaxID=2932257 RepID=UPI0037C0A1CB